MKSIRHEVADSSSGHDVDRNVPLLSLELAWFKYPVLLEIPRKRSVLYFETDTLTRPWKEQSNSEKNVMFQAGVLVKSWNRMIETLFYSAIIFEPYRARG